MWKSLLAVVAGVLTLTITSFAIEAVVNPIFMRTLDLPDAAALIHHSGVKAVTFAYSLVCVAFGGYVSARLAPRLPLRHAIAMGVVQVGMTLLAMRAFPDLASPTQWIVTAILAFPAAVAGGVWYTRRSKPA
jgi:hypothetical protein